MARVADMELLLLIAQLILTTRLNLWCRMSWSQSNKKTRVYVTMSRVKHENYDRACVSAIYIRVF